MLATDARIEVTGLPELVPIPSQLAGTPLLYNLHELRQQNPGRLVDEQVDVLGHKHVRINSRFVTCPGLFQDCLDHGLGLRNFKERKAVEATERDEVESFRFLEPLQAARH